MRRYSALGNPRMTNKEEGRGALWVHCSKTGRKRDEEKEISAGGRFRATQRQRQAGKIENVTLEATNIMYARL